MRLYVEVARRAFRRQTAYPAATLAGLTTNSFWGALRSFLFIGLFGAREVAGGWTQRDAVDYVWLTQAMIMPVYFWGWWEIANTVRSGDVVSDLSKPFDYYTFWLSQDAGRALFHLLFRWLPTLIVGVFLFNVTLPPEPGRWGLYALSLTLAIWVSFGLRFIYNLSAFWLLDHRGVGALTSFIAIAASGFLVPLNYFPEWAQAALAWLPFAALVQVPIQVWLGKLAGDELVRGLLSQAIWAALLLLAGRGLLRLAERKVVIQGG